MDKSIKQLKDVQNAIQQNIESIRVLLDQADALSATINEIEDPTMKDKLSKNLNGLYSAIDSLVANTDDLFDELVEYASANNQRVS